MVELCAFKENKSYCSKGKFITGSRILILVVPWEEKWWQNLRLSAWIHRLYNPVFCCLSTNRNSACSHSWSFSSSLRKHSCGAGAVTADFCRWQGELGCTVCKWDCRFCVSGLSALSYQLTSVFPLVSFSVPKMAKAVCPSHRYIKMYLHSRHKVISLWSCEWLHFALKYDDVFGVVALRFL